MGWGLYFANWQPVDDGMKQWTYDKHFDWFPAYQHEHEHEGAAMMEVERVFKELRRIGEWARWQARWFRLDTPEYVHVKELTFKKETPKWG